MFPQSTYVVDRGLWLILIRGAIQLTHQPTILPFKHPPTHRTTVCNAVVARDRLVQTFRARDTAYGYIVRNDAERFLLAAFKGSNDTQDWIEHDLRSMPFKYHRPCTVDKATGATLRESDFDWITTCVRPTSIDWVTAHLPLPVSKRKISGPRPSRPLYLLGGPGSAGHGRPARGPLQGQPRLHAVYHGPQPRGGGGAFHFFESIAR